MRVALTWTGAVLVGVLVMRPPLPLDPIAPLVAMIGVPLVALITFRQLAPAVFALSGILVGVMGYWTANLIWWDMRCAAHGPGQVTCSRFGEPTPSLAVSALIVGAALILAAVTAWTTRSQLRRAPSEP
jgi:hypothetical protein